MSKIRCDGESCKIFRTLKQLNMALIILRLRRMKLSVIGLDRTKEYMSDRVCADWIELYGSKVVDRGHSMH
jgi:hypothetical protein